VTDARRRSLTLILCCLAQFMVVLDVSIVNVALPSISADLGFTSASLAWVVNAYTLAFAGFLLLGGRAADLLGRREVFAGGLALFALASLAGGLAQSELTLIPNEGQRSATLKLMEQWDLIERRADGTARLVSITDLGRVAIAEEIASREAVEARAPGSAARKSAASPLERGCTYMYAVS